MGLLFQLTTPQGTMAPLEVHPLSVHCFLHLAVVPVLVGQPSPAEAVLVVGLGVLERTEYQDRLEVTQLSGSLGKTPTQAVVPTVQWLEMEMQNSAVRLGGLL